MVMHWNCGTGRWHIDFKYAHVGVFEDQFVAHWSGLQCIESIRKLGLILPVEIEIPCRANNRDGNERGYEARFSHCGGEDTADHQAQYNAPLASGKKP